MKDNEILPPPLSKTKVPRSFIERVHLGKLRDATVEDADVSPQLKLVASNYLANLPEMISKNYGVMFYGENASGKSYLAAAILREAAERRYSCLFVSASQLADTLRMKSDHPFDSEQTYAERCLSVHILAIDGLGSENRSSSGYIEREFLSLLRNRNSLTNSATFITTRLSPLRPNPATQSPLEQVYGTEFQNLLYEMCLIRKVEGDDYRIGLQRKLSTLLEGR